MKKVTIILSALTIFLFFSCSKKPDVGGTAAQSMLRPKTNVWTDPEFSEDTGNGVGRTSESQAPPTRIFSATLSITF